MNTIHIHITGPQGSEAATKVIARAVLELLLEAGIPCAMPEEAENPTDGDSIEALGYVTRSVGVAPLHVIVQTVQTSRTG